MGKDGKTGKCPMSRKKHILGEKQVRVIERNWKGEPRKVERNSQL